MNAVWKESRETSSEQQFCMWAGAVLAAADDFEEALSGRTHDVNILLHSDYSARMVQFLPANGILQVRVRTQHTALESILPRLFHRLAG